MLSAFLVLFLVTAQQTAQPESTPVWGLPLHGEEAEIFLDTAEIVSVKSFKTKGVTRPMKVKLSDGEQTHYALFKTIDDFKPVKTFGGGEKELQFTDCFEYEIAAYELDKLLGLGIVPPTVRRRIGRQVGSLQLWIDGAMTEWERLKVRKVHPPDMVAWNDQMYTIRLFLQLIYDVDYNNVNNLMVTPDWKIYKVDASRAFRNHKQLREEAILERFSRKVLASLRALTQEDLEENLGPWLTKTQLKSLWVRRNLILELAERRVAENGEDAVLFD